MYVYVCKDACTHETSVCVYNVHCSQRVMLCVFDERKLSCVNGVLASHHITYVYVSASVKLYLQKVLLQFYSGWPIFSHLAYLHIPLVVNIVYRLYIEGVPKFQK